MLKGRRIRAMWLLNHGTARQFEVAMLKAAGVDEIFLPKRIPDDPAFRSASVDYGEDARLTIPPGELEVLNQADWYGDPGTEAWAIANRHFDFLFFAIYRAENVGNVATSFRGAIVLRAYGRETSYTSILAWSGGHWNESLVRSLGERFWFGHAYRNLPEIESSLLSSRAVFLPVGLHDADSRDEWTGDIRKILFICPDIGCSPYYHRVYTDFRRDFRDLPYSIGGGQPISLADRAVLGFLPRAQFDENMRRHRVMFYHGTEPRHVHFHPFEAVRSGLPLVFMAGGLLDELGGRDLPGRCRSVAEARAKIRRILGDDRRLTERIRESQPILLGSMKPAKCLPAWSDGIGRIIDRLDRQRLMIRPQHRQRTRIAVILPAAYRGGTLRGAKLLAEALHLGSRLAGSEADVVFGHLDDADLYRDADFADLPKHIARRPYRWRLLKGDAATRAMHYAGHASFVGEGEYVLPDDGINDFLDCAFWIFVSDRFERPLLPIRRYALVVYDYQQRYENVLSLPLSSMLIDMARKAEKVLVTTEFTRRDALQFAGIAANKLHLVPMLVPRLRYPARHQADRPGYFLWTTNRGPHKNHQNALRALAQYYEEHGGRLECRVSGVGTDALLESDLPHLEPLASLRSGSRALRQRLKLLGEVSEARYLALLSGAEFLWHAGRADNGTFSVIEAAQLGVPALSSDYPAMREIDSAFQLSLAWMDPCDPAEMARQLRYMEENAQARRRQLPSSDKLNEHAPDRLAAHYWEAIRTCL
jgi:glycosyltransferase involved in cell wall biosynthesis